jgi:hypothetical protein
VGPQTGLAGNVHQRRPLGGGSVKGTATFKGMPYRLTLDVLMQTPVGENKMARVVINPTGLASTSEFVIPTAEQPALVVFDCWDKILMQRSASRPPSLSSELPRMRAIIDPQHQDYAENRRLGQRMVTDQVPEDLSGYVLVGHPSTMPAMQHLLDQAGFVVRGNELIFDGTSIDLRQGSAAAIIGLGDGRWCGVALGHVDRETNTGRAVMALTDKYGRFLRGSTQPRTQGTYTFKL